MGKTYVFFEGDEEKTIRNFDNIIENFVNRFEGGMALKNLPSLREPGIRIYEIPPGIFVVRSNGNYAENDQKVVRYDIIGGRYSSDGKARLDSLEVQLDGVLKKVI